MFAGRGIALPGVAVTLLVVLVALGLGLGAGWATDAITTAVKSPDPQPTQSQAPTTEASPPPAPPALAPITRELDEADALAGIITADVLETGDGTFAVVPGADNPSEADGEVRWVSVAVERGIQVNASAFSSFVMRTLKDVKGWSDVKSFQFAKTDGAADYRVLLASPATATLLCPDPHAIAPSGPVVGATAEASASAEPSQAPADGAILCESGGVIVLSIYDWVAGLDAFGKDFDASRVYLVQHRMGHLLGESEQTCTEGRASVMVDLTLELPETCEANQWPNPDAVEAPATAAPTVTPPGVAP